MGDTHEHDGELLRRYAHARDEAAFAELVRRYVGLVYHTTLRQTNGAAHVAEDVTQMVFTLLARKAASLLGHQSVAGWLHKTTRFMANDLRRANRRRRIREEQASLMHELERSETGEPNWEQLRPLVDEAVAQLNERDREAVLLRFFANLPLAQIGARLNVSENTARMRVERALGRLQAVLAQRGVTSTAAALGGVLTSQASAGVPAGLAVTMCSHAVTVAAGSVSTTLTEAISLMSGTKLVAGLAVAGLLILALDKGGSVWRSGLREEAALAAERRDVTALLQQLRIAETRARADESDLAQLRTRVTEMKAPSVADGAAKTAATAPADPPPREVDARKEGDAFMARHPAVKAALGNYARARVNFRFGELYDKLGLTAAQIERFQSLVASAGMGSDGPDGRDITLSWRPGKSSDSVRELEALLGPAGMQMYADLSRRDESRNLTTHIAGALCPSETPLTSAQADRLVDVLAGNRVKSGERSGRWRVDWDAAIEHARSFLTPAQMVMLEAEKASELHERVLFDR